jgi:hypothetical protein
MWYMREKEKEKARETVLTVFVYLFFFFYRFGEWIVLTNIVGECRLLRGGWRVIF